MQMGDEQQAERGRHVDTPTRIPAKGWKDVLARVRSEAKDDNVTLLSAGVAFYSLLAMVPGLIALVSMYGLVADPNGIEEQVVDTLAAAPNEVRELISAQLRSIAQGSQGRAVFAVIVGIAVALWSASAGMGHLIEAMNVAYDEDETRGWVRRKAIALGFTLAAILFLVLSFALIALLPPLLADTGLGAAGRVTAGILRYVILFGGMIAGLAILYRYGPARDEAKWRWVSPGALVAAALWTIASIVFSVYTANFGKYNETYGSLAAIVVVMLWLLLTALSVIVGAELNSEIERQTLTDTTEGSPTRLGQRDAYAADTVGETAEEVRAKR